MPTRSMTFTHSIHEIGEDINEYEVSVDIDYSVDDNFGADADNRRGETRLFVEKVTITSIYDLDNNSIDPDDLEDKQREAIINDATETFNS